MGVSGGSLFCAHHVCIKFIRTHTRASPRSRTRRRVSAMMERIRKLSSLTIAESNQKVSPSSGTLFCAYHVMSRIKPRPFACAGPLCKSPGSRRATQPDAHTQAKSVASRIFVVLSECTRLVRLLTSKDAYLCAVMHPIDVFVACLSARRACSEKARTSNQPERLAGHKDTPCVETCFSRQCSTPYMWAVEALVLDYECSH